MVENRLLNLKVFKIIQTIFNKLNKRAYINEIYRTEYQQDKSAKSGYLVEGFDQLGGNVPKKIRVKNAFTICLPWIFSNLCRLDYFARYI